MQKIYNFTFYLKVFTFYKKYIIQANIFLIKNVYLTILNSLTNENAS